MAFTTAQRHKVTLDPQADPHLLLLEIEEEHDGNVIRLAVNNADIVSNGETFSMAQVEFDLPGWSEDSRPPRLGITNVDRAAGRALLLSEDLIMARLLVIDSADPDTAMVDTLDQFVIAAADINSGDVSAELASAIDWNVPCTFRKTTAAELPGVWAQRP